MPSGRAQLSPRKPVRGPCVGAGGPRLDGCQVGPEEGGGCRFASPLRMRDADRAHPTEALGSRLSTLRREMPFYGIGWPLRASSMPTRRPFRRRSGRQVGAHVRRNGQANGAQSHGRVRHRRVTTRAVSRGLARRPWWAHARSGPTTEQGPAGLRANAVYRSAARSVDAARCIGDSRGGGRTHRAACGRAIAATADGTVLEAAGCHASEGNRAGPCGRPMNSRPPR